MRPVQTPAFAPWGAGRSTTFAMILSSPAPQFGAAVQLQHSPRIHRKILDPAALNRQLTNYRSLPGAGTEKGQLGNSWFEVLGIAAWDLFRDVLETGLP